VQAVGERLAAARERAVAAVTEQRAATGESSAALVLRDKAVRVQDFYAATSEARGSWRGPWSGRTSVSGRALQAGRTDGARADLGQSGVRQRGQLDR